MIVGENSASPRALVLLGGDLADVAAVASAARGCAPVIAADGGARHLAALGLRADVVLGDFDSIAPDLLARLAADGVRVERHPAEKDETDAELAFARAEALGAREILVVAALGARADHGLANLALAGRRAAQGLRTWLYDGRTLATALAGGTAADALDGAELDGFYAGRTFPEGLAVSLIPLRGDAVGVRTSGLRFDAAGRTLPFGSPLGVSNRPAGRLADVRVSVREGILLALVAPAV